MIRKENNQRQLVVSDIKGNGNDECSHSDLIHKKSSVVPCRAYIIDILHEAADVLQEH